MLMRLFLVVLLSSVDAARLQMQSKVQKEKGPPSGFKCKDIKTETQDLATMWQDSDWKKCLSCNGAKSEKKVLRNRKTCSTNDCNEIPGCHRVDEFAFNSGVWDSDGDGNSMQFKFMFKPTCVPCIPEPIVEISEPNSPDPFMEKDNRPELVTDKGKVSEKHNHPEYKTDKGKESDTASELCAKKLQERTEQDLKLLEVYSDDCKLNEQSIARQGNLTVTDAGLELICDENCRDNPELPEEALDFSTLIEECAGKTHRGAFEVIYFLQALEKARKACPRDVAPAEESPTCKDIRTESRELATVWEEEDWKRCLSCDGDKSEKKVLRNRKTCSRNDCNEIPGCHRVDKFAFNSAVWESGQQPEFMFKPTCVPCIPP